MGQQSSRKTSKIIENGEWQSQSEESNSPTRIKVSFDAGWQKKGSGRSYNSLTGN